MNGLISFCFFLLLNIYFSGVSFIVSDNIAVDYYASLPWEFEDSDHNPIIMRFKLKNLEPEKKEEVKNTKKTQGTKTNKKTETKKTNKKTETKKTEKKRSK